MAQQFATLALHGLPPLVQNYDTILENAKDRVQKLSIPGRKKSRNRNGDGYQSDYEYRYSSRKGVMDRPRGRDRGGPRTAPLPYQDSYSQPRSSSVEDIPRVFPPPGSAYSPRDGVPKSAAQDPYSPRAGRRNRHDYRPESQFLVSILQLTSANSVLGARRYDSSSDSEASPPPRQNDRRRRNTLGDAALAGAAVGGAYGAARATDDKDDRMANYSQPRYQGRDGDKGRGSRSKGSEKGKEDGSGSDVSGSDSSSDINSSEDERQHKRMRAKELLTAGLAAVATVHAASGVYNSMEARDKRMEKVRNGKLSAEEARKERTKALVQDFAAVGVAALSIKGAMAKWQGANQLHQTRKKHKAERAERQQKRLEKASTYNDKSSAGDLQKGKQPRPGYNRSYSRSEPDLSRQPYNGTPGRYVPAQYRDDNPYGPYGRR